MIQGAHAVKIMLLGSIPKGDHVRKNWTDWKNDYIKKIKQAIPSAVILNGDLISDNKGPELVVGHDLWLVKHADISIADARSKVGAGTAQEVFFAKLHKKPVISIIPKESHNRKSNIVFHGVTMDEWIHPFLLVSSDYIADTIEDAIAWINNHYVKKKIAVKSIFVFEDMIKKFESEMPEVVSEYKERGWSSE